MNAFTRTRDADAKAARIAPDEEPAREAFRPVALPALAAAVLVSAAAAQAVRTQRAARHAARIVHEDEPAL